MTLEEARALVAQLWCLPENEQKVIDIVLAESMANLLVKHLSAATEVVHWTQAVLTALNVGDVCKESLLHKKLREVMIQYRKDVE